MGKKDEFRITKPRPVLSPKEKLAYAIPKSLPVEESMARSLRMFGGGGFEVTGGKIDYKFWHVLLVAAKKILEDGKGYPIFDYPSDLKDAEMELRRRPLPEAQDVFVPEVEYDENYFKKNIDPNLTTDQIRDYHKAFGSVVVITPPKLEAVYVGEGKERVSYTEQVVQFARVDIISSRIRERGRWKGKPVRKYRLCFNSIPSMVFWDCVSKGHYTLIENPELFLALPNEAQTLFCAIVWRQDIPALLKFEEILRIVGWKRWDEHDLYRQRMKVEALLSALANGYWIDSWARLQGDVYRLVKNPKFNRDTRCLE